MVTKSFDFRLNRLRNTMRGQYKTWSKVEPSYPTLARAVEGWKNDIDKLQRFGQSADPRFVKAKSMLEKAWNSRDDRPNSMRYVGKAVKALDTNEEVPENNDHIDRNRAASIKSMYGEDNVQYYDREKSLPQFHEAVNAIKGLQMIDNPNDEHFDYVKAMIENIDDDSVTRFVQNALRQVEMAQKEKDYNPRSVKSHLGRALKTIDQAAVESYDYVPDMDDSYARDEVVDAFEDYGDTLNKQSLYSPDELVPELLNRARAIKATLSRYNAREHERKIDRAIRNFEIALNELGQKRAAVKARGYKSWQLGTFSEYYELACSQMDDVYYDIVR